MKKTSANSAALYVHYPWCLKKCPYCDFNSHEAGKKTIKKPSWTLCSRIFLSKAFRSENLRPFSSEAERQASFPPKLISKLLAEVTTNADTEITIEVNPGSTEHFSFAELKEAGINRVSIGAQSFDDDVKNHRTHTHWERNNNVLPASTL